ncbi:MAG: 50S ribosomal protein L9 [Omnitrophica bacterium]|nr:50S ribosomal protein L9 [Candidatus Omnitrophota bacterium]
MKVILLADLPKLGKEGETTKVKDGYARNYLIPKGLALKATDQNFKRIKEIEKTKSKVVEKQKRESFKLKETIEKISLTVTVEAKDDEELYGTISQAQILKLLKDEGIDLDKEKLILKEPIKKLGVYNLKIYLHPEVEASLRVWVVKK